MLIVCPSCASRYELDGAKLGPDGRKVRCASCQTLWHVAPEPDLPPAPSAEETQAMLNEELERAAIEAQAATSAPPADADATQPRSKRHSGRPARKPRAKAKTRPSPVVIAATLSLTGVVLLGGLFWQRDLVVRAVPQLVAVFETLGYDINVRGLKLGAVESGLIEDEMGRFLVVEGDVTNITKSNTKVPAIEVAVKDAAGQTLYSWKTDPPRQELQPSELMRFRARLASPPATGQSVLVRFAASGPPPAGAGRN